MRFVPPEEMIVHETPHWRINQRVNCPVPGYLMVGAKAANAVELSDLTEAAQREIGSLLAQATRILRAALGAERVYVARFGHDPGHTVHFHVIPVYSWIVAAYHADARYAVEPNPDGGNLTLFIWREYCESGSPPPCSGPSVAASIATLRSRFSESGGRTSG
jgi:diadenosine tetraphosphate (Ap4A) HIT family hydrolase